MNESSLSLAPRKSSQEVAASASAALAKATIEAKFAIAIHRPRSLMNARAAILDACKRPAFAEGALYRVKRGKKKDDASGRWVDNFIEGLSIRFAEQALNSWRNVDVSAVTAWEDESNRLIRITVTDLETNLSYTDEAMLTKTVERKQVREGQEVIAERETSDGGKVFIVRCTDEELANKVNAAKSKAIRNSGLRLIPQDILEEAESAIRQTIEKGGTDPREGVKKLVDAFAPLGVAPSMLEEYLGHSLEQITPREIKDLRGIFAAIRDGEARWSDYVQQAPAAGEEDFSPATTRATTSAPISRAEGTAPAGTGGAGSAAHEGGTASGAPTGGDSWTEPNRKLEALVTGAGFTFGDLVAWGEATGNIPDPTSLGSFADIAPTVATRLLRAGKGLIAQLGARRNPPAP